MIVGYARVSTADQKIDLQEDDLRKAGCEHIFVEHMSGGRDDRPVLKECLEYLQEGDTLVVWKLDRLGRSLAHLVKVINELKERGIHFKSVRDPIDTTNAAGMLFFHMMASFAEFERATIKERVNAGIAAARKRGVVCGGRRPTITEEKRKTIETLIKSGTLSVAKIAKQVGVGESTIYRHMPSVVSNVRAE
jgi:DNA invertase Pin-like site-specific DNA recombinase